MTDWLYTEDDEENPMIKVVAVIIALVLMLLAFMYSYTQQGVAYDVLNGLLDKFGGEAKSGVNTIKYVDVRDFEFKNSTPDFSVPILNLDKPNMFSNFNYTIVLMPSTPVTGKLKNLSVAFKSGEDTILTLYYNSASDDFPDKVSFNNITLPISNINTNVGVYLNLLGTTVFMTDKNIDNIVFNPTLRTGGGVESAGAGMVPVITSIVDYSRENVNVQEVEYSQFSLPQEGSIIVKYPLITQYSRGLPSKVVDDLKQILKHYYVDTSTYVTIRDIVENTLKGDYTTYGYIGADWVFESATYDENENKLTFTFTPVYKVDVEVPYVVLTINYKIQQVTTPAGVINNYFMLTGYDSDIEYQTMTGYDNGELKDLFKSVTVTLNTITPSGFSKNVNLGSIDIITGQALLSHDLANVYMYYTDNTLAIELKDDVKIRGVNFKLTTREITKMPTPYIMPKIYYNVNNKNVVTDTLPTIRLGSIVYYPSKESNVERHVDIIQYDSVEIGKYFVPYKLLSDTNIVDAITSDLVNSKYVPSEVYTTVKNRVSEALNSVESVSDLEDTIINAEFDLKPTNDGIGFKPVLDFQVRYYGVTLTARLTSLIITDDTGQTLYAKAGGFTVEVNERTSTTSDVEYDAEWVDFKSINIVLHTSDNHQLLDIKNGVSNMTSSVPIMGVNMSVSIKSDSIKFEYPIPYSVLPKIKVTNIRLMEEYNVKPSVLNSDGKPIYTGKAVKVKNKKYYPPGVTVNLYTDLYKYCNDKVDLYDYDTKFPLQLNINEAGYYIVDVDGNIVLYDSNGVKYDGNILTVTQPVGQQISNNLVNGDKVIIYAIGDNDGEVIYCELSVRSVMKAKQVYFMELTSLASNKKPGSIKVMTESNTQLIEGYYQTRFYIGEDIDSSTVKVDISVLTNGEQKQVFDCTINSCEYKLGSEYWVFKNSKYTYSDTELGYDANSGSVVLNILPVSSIIDNASVEKYVIGISFKDKEGGEYSAEFTIVPSPRKINVGVTTTNLKYMTVSPIIIYYSLNYYDLYTSALADNYDLVDIVMKSVKVKIVNESMFSYIFNDVLPEIDGKNLYELANNEKFTQKIIKNSVYIYPNLDYDGAELPTNYEPPHEGAILLFLPMVVDYQVSIVGSQVTNYELTISPEKNVLDFVFYNADSGRELLAGQEVTIHFFVKGDNIADKVFDEVMNNIKDSLAEWIKVYLVSPSSTYYECAVEEVTVEKDRVWFVNVKVRIPDDIPQGVYAFNLIQTKLDNMYSPVKNYDELHDENNLNKFFIQSGLDFTADLIIPSSDISGTILYAVNSNELYDLSSTISVRNMGSFIPNKGVFKWYSFKYSGRTYLVYPHDVMSFYIPVILAQHGPSDLKLIPNFKEYIKNTYLISVNLPGFEGYTPKNYVKEVTLLFQKGDKKIINRIELAGSDYEGNPFIEVVKGDKKFYYFPVSLSPYYMTYTPNPALLHVKIEMINGVTVERKIKLIPVVVGAWEESGLTHVGMACTIRFVKKPSWSGFVFSQIILPQTNTPNLIVNNDLSCDDVKYYNNEFSIEKLVENGIELNDVGVEELDKIISSLDAPYFYLGTPVNYPVLYSLAGALLIQPDSITKTPEYTNIVLYMKTDTGIDVTTVVSVSPPNYDKIKEWVKKNGITVTFDGVTFKMIGTKYKSDYLLIVYAKSEKGESYYTINMMTLTSTGGAQIMYCGKTYYIVADGISYTLGVLKGVKIGVK